MTADYADLTRFFAGMSLQNELIAALRSWDIKSSREVTDNTSLIRSGILDSLALLKLALWIEQEVGRPLDPGSIEIAREWDSIADIVRFVERHRAGHPGQTQT